MKITLNVQPRLLRDILASANELGIYGAFWLRNYVTRIRGDYNGIYIGKPIKGREADDDALPSDSVRRTPIPRAYVGAKALAAGLIAALESKNANFAKAAARLLCEDGDASDADIVLQFAAYGKAIWG